MCNWLWSPETTRGLKKLTLKMEKCGEERVDILMQERWEIWAFDRDLSNGLCDISKCSWPREVYYEVLSFFFFLMSKWGRRMAKSRKVFAKRGSLVQECSLQGQKPLPCSGNSVRQTWAKTPFPCDANLIGVLLVSVYLISIDCFFQGCVRPRW